MSHSSFTPIIFAQDVSAADEAARTGIAHASVRRGKISVYIPDGNEMRIEHSPYPQIPFRLNDMGRGDPYAWKLVLMWMLDELVPNPLIIIDHDHPFRELIIFANAWNSLSYGLRFAVPMPTIRVTEYALLGNSVINLFTKSEIEGHFRKKYIGPYYAALSLDELTAKLDVCPVKNSKTRLAKVVREIAPRDQSVADEKPIKLLVLSYFSGPCRAVAVQRINYWLEEISKISDGKIEVHLATAIDWDSEADNVPIKGFPTENLHFVPDHNVASLTTDFGELPVWGPRFIVSELRNATSFNTLSYYWRYALEEYFEESDLKFDVVLISGNPFACFDFAAFAKQRWRSRIILDYRDPFANNPRFAYRDEQREAARYAERGYNFQSDLAVSVNRDSTDLIEFSDEINTLVIENGFDERILDDVKVKDLDKQFANFVHAGSLYHDRSPTAILRSLDVKKHRLHHIGGEAGIDADLLDAPVLVLHGRQTYNDTLGIVGGADCGVVFLSESAFETTTKIYDYLAMGIEVLICTHGEPHVGALSQILEGCEGIHWCKNSEEGVAEFLKTYTPNRRSKKTPNDRFSRRHSTSILIDQIYNLTGKGGQ